MKKVLSILLAVLFILIGCTTAYSAADNKKITSDLEQKLTKMSEKETTEVFIRTTYTMDFKSSVELTEYVIRKTREKLGIDFQISTVDDLDTWSKTYNEILFEIESGNRKVVIEKLGLTDEILDDACNMLIARLTKEQILAAAALDEVDYIKPYAYGEDPWELPTEPLDPPEVDESTLDGKFEKWMWETKRTVKQDDPDEPERFGEVIDYRNYTELYTCEDWTLIRAYTYGIIEPWEFVASTVFGDRVLSWRAPGCADYGYYVYDAAQDTFFAIENVKPENYDGILGVLEALEIGRPLGDADDDNELTVVDATAIQRDLAELSALPKEDVYSCFVTTGSWEDFRYADADRDSDVTVMDATRIQRMLAGLNE